MKSAKCHVKISWFIKDVLEMSFCCASVTLSLLSASFLKKQMNHFSLKILVNFIVKIVIKKTHVSNLMHFQGEMVIFFLKNEALRSEIANFI